MRRIAARIASIVTLLVASSPVWATPAGRIPEPGMLELLALGGVVAGVIAYRNRRK